MLLHDYLQLKRQTLTEFAAEYVARIGGDAENPDVLNAALVRVSRHAKGTRRPSDEDRAIYAELTADAVTAQDWLNLAMEHRRERTRRKKRKVKKKQPPDAAETVAATG